MAVPHVSSMILLALLLGTQLGTAEDRELYGTDFSDFPVGEDRLAGNDGWEGTHVGQQVHGIDSNVSLGLGNTAYLGSNEPRSGTELVSVYRPLEEGILPAEGKVRFEITFGVTESTEGGSDVFAFAFFQRRQ